MNQKETRKVPDRKLMTLGTRQEPGDSKNQADP